MARKSRAASAIVVTGGAGFIGSNLVAGLEARGAGPVVVVDWLGTGEKWRNIAKRAPAAIAPPDQLFPTLDAEEARGGVDTVFHLGAISSTTEADADLVARVNIALPQRLWAWCAERGARFIYASSAATYGGGEQGFDDDGGAEALAKLRPLNAYGWSKHAFDRFVAREAASNAPRPRQWAGLKFFNAYGPNEYHKGAMRSVVHQLYPPIKAGETAKLFKSYRKGIADGGQKRDFVWVGDCVSIMLWLFDNPAVNGLFNAGSGMARSFEDLALAVFAAAGRKSKITYIDMPAELRERYQYFTEARMERLRQAGYREPFTPLEEGVGRYVRDYLAKADAYL
jgi:ADP-L-glycero-D-manno-heptose 6-epimerase